MVGGQLVGTLEEHLVVEDVALDDHLAADEVEDVNLLPGHHLEAHHILLSVGYQAVHLLAGHCQRVAHHAACVGIVLEVLDFLTFGLQLFRRIKGDVGFVLSQQLVDILLIDRPTLALPVRAVLAAERDTLVELDAEPAERLDDIFFSSRYEAVAVGIFNAEHHVATMLAGKQVVVQCSAHTTDVQRSRGTGCKSHPHSSF